MPPRKQLAPPGTVIGYVRVSTEEQADSGLGLAAQRAKLADECARHDWTLIDVLADEGVSAKTTDRPALRDALARVESGAVRIFMVSKLDRLSRSVHDFTGLLERSVRQGWSLVVLDLGIDTSTPNGKFMAHVLASVAQLERELIGQRTSEALKAKKATGAILGRKQRVPTDVIMRIVNLRREGASLQAIADTLNAEHVPTSQGGTQWYPSTVSAVLRRPEAATALDEALA